MKTLVSLPPELFSKFDSALRISLDFTYRSGILTLAKGTDIIQVELPIGKEHREKSVAYIAELKEALSAMAYMIWQQPES